MMARSRIEAGLSSVRVSPNGVSPNSPSAVSGGLGEDPEGGQGAHDAPQGLGIGADGRGEGVGILRSTAQAVGYA